MNRKKMVGIIHTQRNQCIICNVCGNPISKVGLCSCKNTTGHVMTDSEYRIFLLHQTGKRSCSEMSDMELQQVIDAFRAVGCSSMWDEQKRKHKESRRKTMAIINTLSRDLFGHDREKRLLGFLEAKCKKSELHKCSDRELRQVIGWLRKLRQSQLKKSEDTNETI